LAPIKVNFYAPDGDASKAAQFYGANSVVKCLNTRSLSGNFSTIICPAPMHHIRLFLLCASSAKRSKVACLWAGGHRMPGQN